ncbi:hypothetical protein PanWU01x14_326320 [Parasponia andersonii]|uniref:Uncharacterized protein n=1 Tax=Parasponia andersonii TaxID=3476 RepID=A0A2P5AJK4_PARAD|nr:hypothetical protein PanWU01x14_326320 [Parasponia andersonii]
MMSSEWGSAPEESLYGKEPLSKSDGQADELEKQLYKVNNKQETRIHKTERLLQIVEEELMKAEVETALISEGLNRLYIEAYWNEYGKPAMDISIQQGLEMIAKVED